MAISYNFVHSLDFVISILQYYAIFKQLLNTVKIWEFQTQDLKTKVKVEKVNKAVS
jgi:hypothetical protein